MIETLVARTKGQGLHEITALVQAVITRSGLREGLATLFLQHTSASLLIQENADPGVQQDLQAFFARLVPEGDPLWTHTAEGPDDMPSHVKAALTQVSLSIPIAGGRLALGTWQGIYVWEHRHAASSRKLIVHLAP